MGIGAAANGRGSQLRALVQARMTVNRRNVGEVLDAYRLLSSIGVDSFKVRPMFSAGVAIDNEDAFCGLS